RMAATAQVL
nr:Chain P, Phenolphthiocerol/phthiocerol polyketide synthase subunit B [Mycobacterium tuberculosis H37Rv]7P49_Q Chain Q, Phenolphthiocerol/phthiocerol polyketide synthase subunit B [Mycobacterium tuberculosis H37Rv]7P49_R Chain R, Phenolphthiocerol/phthiocerol polyketide synthase subunit B [Mycobacterium tuberculosis H37Rv]7P49_Z Chain Z, Phenolphthiocerol/phthiocerol polyketide synthase subunit B [Mycobacterium tuberculosis H37Rv]